MAQIIADDLQVQKTIERIEQLVVQGGGWVHPDIKILSNKGDMRVEYEGSDEAHEKLALLTRETLLPIEDVEVFAEAGKLNFKPVRPDSLTKMRHELFELMFELYNYSDKIAHTRESNFWFTLKDDVHIMERLVNARSSGPAYEKMKKFLQNPDGEDAIQKHLVERFISMRVLGFGGKADARKPGKSNMPVLMPIIDIFNHHDRGGRFQSADNTVLEIKCSKPVEGSDECFAFYGFMDAMDAYLRYGFVDTEAAIVRSIPLQIDVPNIGRLVIESKTPTKMNAFKLTKESQDLAGFMPNINRNYDVLTLSHLFIPASHSPYAMRRIIGGCVKQLTEDMDADEIREVVRDVEQRIVDANLKFYRDLTSYLDDLHERKDYTNKSAIDTALLLSRAQENKVGAYQTINQEES